MLKIVNHLKKQTRRSDRLLVCQGVILGLVSIDIYISFCDVIESVTLIMFMIILISTLGKHIKWIQYVTLMIALLVSIKLNVLGVFLLKQYYVYNARIEIISAIGLVLVIVIQVFRLALLKSEKHELSIGFLCVLTCNICYYILPVFLKDPSRMLGFSTILIGFLLGVVCCFGIIKLVTNTNSILRSYKVIITKIDRYNHYLPCMYRIKDGIILASKIVIVFTTHSAFMIMNFFYSMCLVLSRSHAYKMSHQDRKLQVYTYKKIGCLLIVMSIFYVLYTLLIFIRGSSTVYPMNIALLIALYTFIEFGFDLRDILRIRKTESLKNEALRMIGLASTSVLFVLTQTAIMSFSFEGDTKVPNALSGLFFGSLVIFIGIYMNLRSRNMLRTMRNA